MLRLLLSDSACSWFAFVVQNSGYYKNINYDLLANIPQSSKSVLEIGCGAGYLGAAYKLRNPSVHYVGVEYVPEEAESAKNFLD